jgi:hypothetical protein
MTTSVQPAGKNPAYRVWRSVPEAERNERLQGVITRFVNDEKLADIAKDIGLSHSALCMALLEYAEDDWKRAQVARAITRLEKSRTARDEAADMLNLVRARDDEKSAQWELERLLRRLYGQEQQQTASQVVIMLGTDLRAAQQTQDIRTEGAQVIDSEPLPTDSESVAQSVEGAGGIEK